MSLLEALEGFFGTLDSDQLLASQFESASYRNEVLYRNIGYFGSHGGGTTMNMEAPKFYGGYKARSMPKSTSKEDIPKAEQSATSEAERKSTFEATQRDIEQKATRIVEARGWSAKTIDFVKQVLTGRIVGLTDKAIYRQLARVYHPDQTTLEKLEAEEMFKFIGQQLDDDSSSLRYNTLYLLPIYL